MIRQLAPSELYYFRSETWVSYSTIVEGPVDTGAMSAAGAMLQAMYPVLAARVNAEHEKGPALVLGPEQDDAAAFVIASKGSAESAVAELGSRTAGVRIGHRDDGATAVTLLTNHAIADAQHSLHLLSDLWSTYTDIVNGATVEIASYGYPDSTEGLLADRGVPCAARTEAVSQWEPVPSNTEGNPYGQQPTERIRLSVKETDALIAAARREGTTVNGVVSAALIQAGSTAFGISPLELLHRYPVDVRRHMSPIAEATEGTTVLGQATYSPVTDRFADLYSLARDVSASLKETASQWGSCACLGQWRYLDSPPGALRIGHVLELGNPARLHHSTSEHHL